LPREESLVREITLDGGVKVKTFSPPPPGFHPLTASTAELTKYGFPARPDRPEHLERYRRVFDRIKKGFHYIEPTFKANTKRRHGLASRQVFVQAGNEYNLGWSGGVVYAPRGESFRWIVGEWTVPNVNAPTENQEYYSSIWIGLDGDPVSESPDVCQVGVNCDVSRSGASISGTFYPWWEWYQDGADTGEMAITNVAVGPGDTVGAVIFTTGAGATEATGFFANLTRGEAATPFVMEAMSGVSLVGNSAEWIVERPNVDGQVSMLADYVELFFSGCDAVSYTPNGSSSQAVGGGTGNYIDMNNYALDILSQGILVAPTVVECIYMQSD
jgi:hypothetical protein